MLKKPFSGPEQVLTYLGRYTHRIAIGNHRIEAIEGRRVVFTYKDRSDANHTKTMDLSAMEFIRRFLIHVLPYRFMKCLQTTFYQSSHLFPANGG